MGKQNSILQKLIKPFTVNSTKDDDKDLEELTAKERKHFSYATLVRATNNFDSSRKLGEGGFGPVFRGILEDGREVAVKKLSQTSAQGKKEFENEAKSLACLQHRNVVNLLGYCVNDQERLLVYEYMQNESLDKLLFKSNRRDVLDWKRRYDVIIGVTRGLLYLHEEAPGCIFHRDIKASNILLDDKWIPKIADFGMARWFPEDQTHATTRMVGTNGYMAPEYFTQGFLSKKADVFSFGVVILELISGQKNSAFNRDPDSSNLLEWAYKLYRKQRSWEIVDPLLSSSIDEDRIQIENCLHAGLLCVQSDQELRPKMIRVHEMLVRRPKNIEEPAPPGYYGSSYTRRHNAGTRTGTGTSASGSSTRSSSHSSEFVSHSSTIPSMKTAPARLENRGKRPAEF